jgi:uncharacterized RDD family membrane protein YckC
VLEARAAETARLAPTPDLDQQVEQLVRRALENPALEQMLVETIHSKLVTELADEITQSPAFKRMLANVLTSDEVRTAMERQTASFGADVVSATRRQAQHADDAVESRVHRLLRRSPVPRRPFAGIGTRGTALITDSILVWLIFLVGGSMTGLVASLFGTLRPMWLVDAIAGAAWAIVVVGYFVGFWSSTGQTPGMRLMRVRVVDGSGKPPSGWRSFIRLVGLAVAVILLFTGFIPALVDSRRRALQDYLAGTTVVYDPQPD